jgi:hypothetical protein
MRRWHLPMNRSGFREGLATLVILGAAVGFGVGCSSSSSDATSGALDCAWVAGDNCWKTTVSAAASCTPPPSEFGTLSPDNSTCTYPSGEVIAFNPPLDLDLQTSDLPNMPLQFTITTSTGQTCLWFEQAADGAVNLAVQGQLITESFTGSTAETIGCSDGTSYMTSDLYDLLACSADGSFNDLPVDGWSSDTTGASLTLFGASATLPNGLQIFDCLQNQF